ncbi:hypothetical protein J5N97_003238 [Dioscorea zingiberensis]|uniref:Uncharacterized protein n=1 Tax=Dioscorea zingiberensis TaxID=325984 RepID=A0A9D5D5U0_9LILI|nr:hypothetical protein J5N97_003238 [Dioscorea zingiberensis]
MDREACALEEGGVEQGVSRGNLMAEVIVLEDREDGLSREWPGAVTQARTSPLREDERVQDPLLFFSLDLVYKQGARRSNYLMSPCR